MTALIPAAPGWYIQETDDGITSLDPVIAWTAGTDQTGEPTLLPFVDGGTGSPPLLMTADSFQYCNRRIVYRPNHDPGDEAS
ncbi:hypothetical protein [Streptomyces sp. PAM3C]|uniref:hypothetical protein n=1 Tax=Streptomyces sp. PAM3C TaxID=2847300 RepID=UPI001C1E3E44|nr:hypothetical protein [Streptomyces sp. PAM3C]MBU5944913.1 hypothetical protein [Streptomyces sp. PAM3C]